MTQWVDRGIEPDEMTKLDKTNNEIIGKYLGTKVVEAKFGESQIHVLHVTEGGTDYKVGVWGFGQLDKVMESIPHGTMIKMVYKGEKDVGKGNPMQMATVYTAPDAGTRTHAEAVAQRIGGSVEF